MSDDQPTPIPEWIATLIGSLTMENHALRRMLAELQQAPPPEDGPSA